MCGFQKPGQGFFYIPDDSTAYQLKERSSTLVISVLEGSATVRELEHEFNVFFGSGWRCTARPIGPGRFTMRLPNPKEVERAVYYGERMRLRTIDATVRLSTWTASVGAKAKMQKAWVRVSNIPLDKRTEKIAYYAGSLVGVSLELDMSTLHKPEFVRLLIGCKDVETMADSAEGVLGDDFYDFYYEIERIVVGGPPKQTSTVVVDGSGVVPSPKRARTTYTASATEETSVEQGNGSQTDSARYGKNCDSGKDMCGADEDSPDDSMEDQELFLDKLAR
jgi:hypothetical protein